MKQKLIIIAGATATGKTACAVRLCERIPGEVISADSMQIYAGMEILTAAPTAEETRGIPHHLVGIADPAVKFTAPRFRELAREAIADIAARGRIPVLCGGAGLYINAVIRPMEFSRDCDEELRRSLMEIALQPGGRKRLHEMLEEIDPEAAERLHENDVRRVSRAIEVYRLTGKTQSEQAREDAARESEYDFLFFLLDWPREVLYQRIDARVDRMLAAGLVEEVRRLHAQEDRYPTAEQAIGYREICCALDGKMSMEDAIVRMKTLSRNYAKKQETWFKREPGILRIPAMDRSPEDIAEEILTRAQL